VCPQVKSSVVVTISITCINIRTRNCYHDAEIISRHSINYLEFVFVMEMLCVSCEVGNKCLNIKQLSHSLHDPSPLTIFHTDINRTSLINFLGVSRHSRFAYSVHINRS
jgi:hypothetical protein